MPGRKRAREVDVEEEKKKRQKIIKTGEEGDILVLGEGDVGQLGLGEDILERTRPTLLPNMTDKFVQVVCGGMHTVCVSTNGEVYTFGCNDEGALGRDTSKEGSEMSPAKVPLEAKIVQVSAGDSHTAAITDDGRLYIWGNFRDSNGSIGLTVDGIQKIPMDVLKTTESVVKVSSGGDHIACLTAHGDVYTWGCAEQGQLGRVAECFANRGGRKGLSFILTPSKVKCMKHKSRRKATFSDVWAGQFCTYAKEVETGEIYSWGLNNYFQLGFGDMVNRFVPERVASFSSHQWRKLEGGQHHVVALNDEGHVCTLGRAEYGRLGLGEEEKEEKAEPIRVPGLEEECVDVAAGQTVSYALTKSGQLYAWGMGTSQQLGTGLGDDDAWIPTKMVGKYLQNRSILMISAGGQHTALLAKDSKAGVAD